MNIDMLIERYIGKYVIRGGEKTEVYKNPSRIDFKNMREELGIDALRFIIFKPSNEIFVWNAWNGLHYQVFNILVDKGEIESDLVLKEFQYDHPDVICGHAEVGVGKMKLTSKSGYAGRSAEIGAEYAKYFYKAGL